MLGDDEPKPEFCCHGCATAHLVPKPLRPVPKCLRCGSCPRSPGQPRPSTAAWGPPAPITRSAGEDLWVDAHSFPRSLVSKLVPNEREAYRPGYRNPTKTRALSRGFPAVNQDISGFAGRIFDSSHTVTALTGLKAAARGAGRHPCRAVGRPGDRPGCVSLWWPAGGGPGPGVGRLAQRESASFTPRRSLVRSQYRPPGISPGQRLQDRPYPTSGDGAFRLFGRNLGDQLLVASQG